MIDTPNGRVTIAANPNQLDRVARTPLGRMATAWDIAYAVSFSRSDQSSFATSQRWRSTAAPQAPRSLKEALPHKTTAISMKVKIMIAPTVVEGIADHYARGLTA
ncbi:hypothetical protein P3H15_34040 [Rhodococcus sp. T2V]|uniref:hypothetical protein n=1 Tax=Rhodococcus sp. T2V TaxID=3034164 RepID=UPI0023E0F447|nr:hypothetical protein [Rhodococcus sp. T2V]MDF3310040.1 hypothetical protein [Rhodococcus sp. T2V]